MNNIYWYIKHQFFDCLRFFGLRDRLRCPQCTSIGTYKPHGGWFDGPGPRRRWLCKWCGYYANTNSTTICRPDKKKKCWSHNGKELTPQELCKDLWPWRG